MTGILYLVGTPIGNLGDLSPRAIQTLKDVDFIAAEDTRVTRKLLTHFQISNQLISYHKHNSNEQSENIISRLLSGQSVAIVSDAGMPVISDPGQELINLAHKSNVKVLAIPGPSASITALALSGMESNKFLFEGFLQGKTKDKREQLTNVQNIDRTLIYYEAPHKLLETLKIMLDVLGDRNIALSREITKIYEETLQTTISQSIKYYDNILPKGEFVIVVEGLKRTGSETITLENAVALVLEKEASGASLSHAAKDVANLTGYKKSELYKLALGSK